MLFGDPNGKLCERTLRSQLSLRAQVAWQAYRQRRLLRGGRANVLASWTATAPFVASKRAKDPSPALTQSSHCRTKKLGLFFQLLLPGKPHTHAHIHTHTHTHTHTISVPLQRHSETFQQRPSQVTRDCRCFDTGTWFGLSWPALQAARVRCDTSKCCQSVCRDTF